MVTGGIKIRFYAGAALVSPEGYKLGTLCIISNQVRPQGLSTQDQAMMHNMARMVVSTMVARQNRLVKEENEAKFHSLARTFMDTTQSLELAKDNPPLAVTLVALAGLAAVVDTVAMLSV